jgi:hypothetical protein
VLAVAVAAAAGSVYVGARRALSPAGGFGSSDFQWSPTRLFLDGIDPYQARLDGSPDIILTQSPNYLHLLYEVLLPFGALPFDVAAASWLVLSLVLAVGLAVFYARTASLGPVGTVLLVAMLLSSTPLRLGLGYGQHAVFLLVFATMAFVASSRSWAGAPLAVALTKYSFAPLALVMLVAGRLRNLVVAGVVLLAAAAVFAVWTSTGLVATLLAPLIVSRAAVGAGAADLMTVAGLTPWLEGNETSVAALAVIGSCVLALVARRQIRSGDWVFVLGIGSVISLLCFKHLVHDLVFLLPVVVLALRMRGSKAALAWGMLAYHWFAVGVVSQLGTPMDTPAVILTSFVAMSVLFGVLLSEPRALRPANRSGTPARGDAPASEPQRSAR